MAGTSNLRPPWKPGETGNPKGINQHTYRQEAEAQFAKLLTRKLRKRVSASEQIIDRVIKDAILGIPAAQKLALERILPVVSQHEVAVIFDPEQAELADSLDALAQRRRTNGSGRSADAPRTEDAGS